MNCLILGWVTKAMVRLSPRRWASATRKALAICVFFLIPFTGLYVALGGLWGVLWTDLFQFALKMAIVIGVAWYAVAAAAECTHMLASWRRSALHAGPGRATTALLP